MDLIDTDPKGHECPCVQNGINLYSQLALSNEILSPLRSATMIPIALLPSVAAFSISSFFSFRRSAIDMVFTTTGLLPRNRRGRSDGRDSLVEGDYLLIP